ncbi:MAG TPA: hypothetical protein VJO16_10130 [Candidatus Acidoferrum sp.]|nr:hypothetical protein [Candidatus Acidoferrum sp.]
MDWPLLRGALRIVAGLRGGACGLLIVERSRSAAPFVHAGDHAIVSRFFLSFSCGRGFLCHAGVGVEKELRHVGEGDGVATGDAFTGELRTKLPRKRLTLSAVEKLLTSVRSSAARTSRVDKRNLGAETVSVEGAESRWSGSVAMVGVNQHVAALSAGVLELTVIHGKLFWGHGLAFPVDEVMTR